MTYATPADLLERYETEMVAQRAAPDGERVSGELLRITVNGGDRSGFTVEQIAAADVALERIVECMADADGVIDSYLAKRFPLPLAVVPRVIRRLACDIARFMLWGDAASVEGVEEREYKSALKMLAAIRDGEQQLGVQPEPEPPSSSVGMELIEGNERLFTRRSMRGL